MLIFFMNVGTAFTDVYFLAARYSAVTLTKNTSNVMKNKSEDLQYICL